MLTIILQKQTMLLGITSCICVFAFLEVYLQDEFLDMGLLGQMVSVSVVLLSIAKVPSRMVAPVCILTRNI